MSLPSLPIPVIQPSTLVESASGVLGALYLREQMQAYGQACMESERDRFAELFDAAQGVIDRWDSPLWKDQPHTAEYIARLRAALEELT